MLIRAIVLLAAASAMAAPAVAQSPPLTKGTGLAPDPEDLPARVPDGPPPSLDAVAPAESGPALPGGALCELRTESGTTLVAGADRQALARPGGMLTPMLYEGPALRAGGYFTAGPITIVVEPDTATAHAAADGGTEWKASAVIDRAGRNARHAGTWRCKG